TENPVQPAEESTTNSEKVSPDTSSENTGEVSSNPSDSTTSVGESNKPEKNGTATKPENSGNTTSENGQTEPEPSNGNSTEDVSTESNTSNSNGNEEIKQENELDPDKKVEEPEKTLELRNVSDLELYSLSNGTYKQHISLEQVPSNPNSYFVKVKSSSFKDVYLPVASISEERKNDKILYKITAKVEKLQQEIESRYKDNFTFYLAKKGTEETTNFTSFSNLVKAINQNLSGTYHLGASLNANEVELSTDDKSYIKGTFTGQLIGEKDGKHYAIYNLKKPLFESLRGATIEKLSLKNVSISGKDDIGSLANEAQNNTKIKQVHVDGVLAGERGIGGLLAKADQSSITESSFKGRIVNTYETTAAYNIGGMVGHLTGDKALLTKSKATVAISSNTNTSDQTVGGLAGLVDRDAQIQDSYAEGDINNVKHFGRVAGVAGNLWDRTSGDVRHAGSLTNVLSDVNVTNGNAITGYHYNEMKVKDTFSSKDNRVYNVTLVKDEVVSKESFEERGTMLDASQIASKKAEINPLILPTVEPLSTSGKKDSDFSKVAYYQAKRNLTYKNIEKLLPFYNKATIVKYGNLVNENSLLYQKELLSAVVMKDNQVITDIVSNKQTANKLLLHYKDDLSEKLDLKYQNDFAKLAEYSLGNTGLLYTPNQFLYDQTSIIKQVLLDLQKDGAITYTHEMTHDSDQDIYLGGYGRRSGLGPEFFAKGLLQAPDHPDDATITINSILKHSKSDSTESRRLQVLDPTTRFNNADDLKQYVHNMFDVVYMLEYLEGNSILKLDTNQKQQLLRKVTNEYHPDPDGNKVYATNVVRNLTVEEVERLRSFNDLIDNNILSSREYASGKYERNGYFTIKLFAPIYAALSNDIGTPGDLMGRRIAYELLAAKGFKDGMVPYISNQYEEEAKQKGKTINLYGKTRGLVTDDLVLEKVFNNQYHTWSEFKKAMYQERQDQFDRLNKVTFNDTTQPWQTFAKKTTSSVDELQKLMDVAVRKDAEHNYYHWNNYNPDIDSEVHKLKRAIFKAYLDQTNDFRSSIFENKK
ncbi:TPA: ZmpA/ZmpB/ZmpC family metallo-endopeptidase, partial [Streptococcus pneumoniae]